jgi:hypothetical protein
MQISECRVQNGGVRNVNTLDIGGGVVQNRSGVRDASVGALELKLSLRAVSTRETRLMKMRFGEVAVGSRFGFQRNTYLKTECSIALDGKDIEVLFPTDAIVEVADEEEEQPEKVD